MLAFFVPVSVIGQDKPTGTVKSAMQVEPLRTVIVNGAEEPVYRVGKGITAPRVVYSPEPEYSNEARRQKVGGVVTLGVVVTSAGKVTDIRVLNGRGYGLDEKAVEAVRHWKFQPASKDGKPVSVEIALEIMFRLYENH